MSDGTKTVQVGAFEALLGELDTIAKSLPADGSDAAIAAAASDAGGKGGKKVGGDIGGDKGDKGKTAGDKDGDEEEMDADGKPIMKSISVVVDGKTVEAVDGTAMIKSLMMQLELTNKKVDESENIIAKALSKTLGIVKSQEQRIQAQDTLIKSLQEGLGEVGGRGAGRKTLLSIVEPQNVIAKSQNDGMTGAQFLAKAEQAFSKKAISGLQFTTIDVCLRNKTPVDEGLVQKVMNATASA